MTTDKQDPSRAAEKVLACGMLAAAMRLTTNRFEETIGA